MPVPTPNSGEEQQHFISRCISFETKASPGRDPKQIQAMCYDAWRSKGKKGVRGGDRGGPRKRPLRQSIKYLVPITLEEALENEALVTGTAISATTSRNKITYKVEGLEKNKTLDGTNLSVGHSEDPADNVGIIEGTKWDGKNLNYNAKIYNTAKYPDAIEMVRKKLWQYVSIEAIPTNIKKEKEGLTVNDLEFIGLAFVKSPGVKEASAALAGESFGEAICEAFDTTDLEEEIMEDKQPEEKVVEKIEEKKVIEYKTDPKVLELLEGLMKEVKALKEQAEEEDEEEEEDTKTEKEEEVEEKSKAVVEEKVETPETNIIFEGPASHCDFWVMPETNGTLKEAI